MKIFLIGFMGCGKTYWGKRWSQQTALPFFDLDEMIVKQENKTITAIFDEYGEVYFREKERVILKTFSQVDKGIIACGGGTACFSNNMDWMNANGITVYIKTSPEVIFSRLVKDSSKRPLLKNVKPSGLLQYIKQKLTERESFYHQAKIVLAQDKLNENSIKEMVKDSFNLE